MNQFVPYCRRTLVHFLPQNCPRFQPLFFVFAPFLVLFFLSSHGGWSSQSDVSISTENSMSEVSTGTQGTRVSLPQSVQNPEQLSISQVRGWHQHVFNIPSF